jgi:DNA-binding CsgD family transcriptional regulator
MSAEQARLTAFERDDGDDNPDPDLSVLTEAELEVYHHVITGRAGARQYARETNRSPGTISNLLRRARDKLTDQEGVDV